MRSRVADALAFVGVLGCAACGIDETGLEPVGLDGSTDVTFPDATPTGDSHSPKDARPPEDHTMHDAADAGGTKDAASEAPDHSDAAEGGGDSSLPADAGKDVGGSDAGKDSGGSDAGSDSGGADSGGGFVYTCGSDTTTDCSSGCTGNPVSCVYCTLTGHTGFCGREGTLCLNDGPPAGSFACSCLSTSGCFTSDQICVFPYCESCGEPGTDKQPCKGGGTCTEATSTCSP